MLTGSSIKVLGCLRNVLDILEYLPKDKQSKNFIKNGNEMFEGRLKMGSSRKDIFSHLLGKDEKTGCKFTKKELLANSTLLVVAGGGKKTERNKRPMHAIPNTNYR